jgi:aminoglycoside N3'-acetyltransferase
MAEDLVALGLRPGRTVLLHSSLKQIGWVIGGAPTVVRAFLDVLGPEGTLVVPTGTADNTDPERWASTTGRAVCTWPSTASPIRPGVSTAVSSIGPRSADAGWSTGTWP